MAFRTNKHFVTCLYCCSYTVLYNVAYTSHAVRACSTRSVNSECSFGHETFERYVINGGSCCAASFGSWRLSCHSRKQFYMARFSLNFSRRLCAVFGLVKGVWS